MVITILIVWTFYGAGCAMDEFPFRCRELSIKIYLKGLGHLKVRSRSLNIKVKGEEISFLSLSL